MPSKFLAACILALCAPLAAKAQEQDGNLLRTAYFESAERGPTVAYLSDAWRAAPRDDLLVITYTRPVAAWHFNSPRDEVNGLHRWLKEHSAFTAEDMVAVISEKPMIRVFIKPLDGFDPATFDYPRATLSVATADDIAGLKAIGEEDFAAYAVEKLAERQRTGNQLFGEGTLKTMPARLRATIAAGTAGSPGKLRGTMKRDRNLREFDIDYAVQGELLMVEMAMDFDRHTNKAEALRFFEKACAAAALAGGQCTSWQSRAVSQKIQLQIND